MSVFHFSHATSHISWRRLRKNTLAFSGLIVIGTIFVAILLTPLLPLADPNAIDPQHRLLPPLSSKYLLGSDHLGRDILSRLLWGTRMSILISVYATLFAAFFGSLIGIIAAYVGGKIDNFLMRIIDVLMAFPYILLALGIVAILGPGLMNAMYAVATVSIPFFARNIRGVTLSLLKRPYIEAAKLAGKSHRQIITQEIFPNILPIVIIMLTTTLGWMVLETAGLSFLGLGAQPPQSDLGAMLGEGRKLLYISPHLSIIPGLLIFALVMSINVLGDGIRDMLDPRLQGGELTSPGARTTDARETTPTPKHNATGLCVQNLCVEFHAEGTIYHAVNNVDLQLNPGECLGLVGESGSGKSITALALTGLVPSPPGKITSGCVSFENKDLLNEPLPTLQKVRGQKIAYVFQDPLSSLHPLMTVGDQITEAVRAHHVLSQKQAWQKMLSLLQLVQIPSPQERAHYYPHQLSGGMRQRILIAIALANDAEILIADEPTTALDVTVQAQILSLLKDLQKQRNIAILLITHDFGVVSYLCQNTAVMYAGQIIEMGPTADILSRPSHPYTQKLLDCVPILGKNKDRYDTIKGSPPLTNEPSRGCAFYPRCPLAESACLQNDIALIPISHNRQARCIKPLGEHHD